MKNNMKIILSLGLAVLVLLSMTVAGCGNKKEETSAGDIKAESKAAESETAGSEAAESEAAESEVQEGGAFIYPVDSDIVAINPLFGGCPERYTMLKPLFDPFYIVSNEGTRYYLAEKYDVSEDGLTVTLKLRDGMKWHDGEPITADDIVYNFSLASDPRVKEVVGVAFINNQPVQVEKKDDLTVEFKLPEVDAYWITKLGKLQIIAKHIYENEESVTESALNETPVGNGPFKFKAWNKGESLELVRNDDYYRGRAKLDSVTFKVISDASAREIALQNGELSAMPLTEDTKINKYSKDENYKMYAFDEGRTNYMAFNVVAGVFGDIKARQAIAYALNRDEIVKGGYGSEKVAIPANSSFSPSSLYYDKDIKSYEQDVDKAKQLIDECGLKGKTLRLVYNHLRPNQKEQALVIQQQLKDYDINIEVTTYDTQGFYSVYINKEGDTTWDLALNGYDSNGDPGVFRHLLRKEGLPCTGSLYVSKEKEALWDEADRTLDSAKREELFKKIMQQEKEDYTIYPIAYSVYNIVAKNNIQGLDAIKIVPVFEDYLQIYMTK